MHIRTLFAALALALPLVAAPKHEPRIFANLDVEIGEASSFEISLSESAERPPVTEINQDRAPRGAAAQ